MPSSTDAQHIADHCARAGLDLSATTSVGRYNATVDQPFHLPGPLTAMVVVIGNTRALWPHLDQFVCSSSGPIDDPVDTYVERVVGQATAGLPDLIDVRYSHEPPPRRVAIQRLAHEAGLAWLSPSHLCVHPTFGPWMALRAAVVLNQPAPLADAPPLDPPCDCSTHCLPMLERALAAAGPKDAAEPISSAELIEHWKHWLAMRDACPVGRQHRYTDEQIVYHYIGQRPARWG